ncbi:MAG: RNB domain-containing ribonuclease [Thermoleophilia bacterium]
MAHGGPTTEVVAEMVVSGRGAAARPAFAHGLEIPMSTRTRGDARVGDLAMLSVRGRSARVLRVFGGARAPKAVMAALLASEGMGHGFPRAVEREVDGLSEGDPLADPGRRDLTGQDVVTIDPLGAKDHDDAIAAQVEGADVRVWVHIADVAHYVAAGSAVDREAARRGCSVYVPGTVEPMLPARLSNDLCSLRPEVPRRVLTVEMVVDPEGRVTSTHFFRAVIRSERRLTYPEVDAYLAGTPLGAEGMETTVDAAREASRRLRAARDRRGGLEVDSGEVVFELDADRVDDAHVEEQTDSHRIVEDCMVAANEAVARHLIQRGVPTLFRHHPDPDPGKVRRLYEQMETLGVPTPGLPERELGPTELRAAVGTAGQAVSRHVGGLRARGAEGGEALWTLVLRALMQAYYTPAAPTHSGLASPAYLHFTSPIRRYPDLLVHRALLAVLGCEESAPTRTELELAGEHCSLTEREADGLERRADRIIAAILLEERLLRGGFDEVFQGEVSGVIAAGGFVRFGVGFEGFLPARSIEDDLVLDECGVALVRDDESAVLRIGDPVAVRVLSVDPLRGRVRLVPAGSATPAYMNRARARRRATQRRH